MSYSIEECCSIPIKDNVPRLQDRSACCFSLGLFSSQQLGHGCIWICIESNVVNTGILMLLMNNSWTFSASCPSLAIESCRCTSSCEGTELEQLTPAGHRNISYCMAHFSAFKAGGRRRKKGMLQVMAFVFPSNCSV